MSNKINAIRGMNDCLPKDSHLWLSLEKIIFDTFITYGFKNIRTPIVEKTDTFCRAIGLRALVPKHCALIKDFLNAFSW
jgi:histidyl-tRNA synthetase